MTRNLTNWSCSGREEENELWQQWRKGWGRGAGELVLRANNRKRKIILFWQQWMDALERVLYQERATKIQFWKCCFGFTPNMSNLVSGACNKDLFLKVLFWFTQYMQSCIRSWQQRCSRFSRSGFIWMWNKTRGASSSRYIHTNTNHLKYKYKQFLNGDQVAEISADGRRAQIFMALSTAGFWDQPSNHSNWINEKRTWFSVECNSERRTDGYLLFSAEFRDQLSAFSDFYSSLGPPNPGR